MNYRVFLILSSLLLANKAEAPVHVPSKEEERDQNIEMDRRLKEQEAQKSQRRTTKNKRSA